MLASGWNFRFDAGAGDPAQEWRRVEVPHSWNKVGVYADGVLPGSMSRAEVDKRQGVGWYRLDLQAPVLHGGQRAWLEFGAASRTAQVWLNGKRLGAHAGAFSTFRFDATDALKPGVTNHLEVRVDNTPPVGGNGAADGQGRDERPAPTLPLMGDFFVYGGLYRAVKLIVTDPVHFDLLDHGGSGVYATTRAVQDGRATIGLEARLRNDSARRLKGVLVTRLIDRAGQEAARFEKSVVVPAGETVVARGDLALARAHLWQGTADPYLYRLVAQIVDERGRVRDAVSSNFGVRTIAIDPEKGFLLNGDALRLHGVGLHQDLQGKGWALSDADVRQMVETIREMGANTIRLTHYQHGQAIHDLADQLGLIVWDEIPLVSSWTLSADEAEAPPAVRENARQQLVELIRQNYNHPSVAVWGIANEVDFGPNRPDFIGTAPQSTPDPRPLLVELNALAKQEDASRPTVLANCCEDTYMKGVPDVSGITDAMGVNRYLGWYHGSAAELGQALDALHAKHPRQPLAVTEYGGGGAISVHTDDPLGGRINPGGREQPEEFQAFLHEQTWPILKDRPYLWATWLWNAFDFSSTSRHEGDSTDINTKGLVTYDGKLRKDAWWYYKANWSAAPTLHIAGRRNAERAYSVSDIKVYSNASATELFVNGTSLGVRRECAFATCIWPGVRLAAGDNRIEARASSAGQSLSDAVEWKLAPAQARDFRIDSGAIVAASGAAGFGSDAYFEGGEAASLDTRTSLRGPPVRATIAGALDRDLVASVRTGDFTYRVPVLPGRYVVRLTFAEPDKQPGARTFDVLAGSRAMLSDFDVAAAAGGPLRAITRSFTVPVRQGPLELRFRSKAGKAIVSAIEVEAVR